MTRTEQWQRLAPLALVFLLIGAVQKLIRENLFLFAGAGFGAAVFDWIGLRELVLIGLVGPATAEPLDLTSAMIDAVRDYAMDREAQEAA